MGKGEVMKKRWIAVIALMPVLVMAKPFGAMSEEEIKASDSSRWGNRVSLSGEPVEEMGRLTDNIRILSEKLKACTEEIVMLRPDKIDVLKELANTLAIQLVADNVGRLAKPDDPPHVQRGYERLNSFKVMLQALERKSRKKLRILVTDIIGFQMVERRSRWSSVQLRLDNLKTTSLYRDLDTAFESFMNNVDKLTSGNIFDVTGTEVMRVSKLDDFANADCKANHTLDGRSRVVDRYLLVMNRDALNAYQKYTATIKTESADTLSALAEDYEFYEKYALQLLPADRKLVEQFFKEVSQFLEHIDTFLVKESEKMLQKAQDKSTEVGQLRFCTGFASHRAFFAAGPVKDDCCQGYARRVRVMLEDCKKRYMKHLDLMRQRYGETRGKYIPKGWQ